MHESYNLFKILRELSFLSKNAALASGAADELDENIELLKENNEEFKQILKKALMSKIRNVDANNIELAKVIADSNECFVDILQELENIKKIFGDFKRNYERKDG